MRGFVYFIQQDVTQAVKIGYSGSVRGIQQRLTHLQTASPYGLRVLCHTPGEATVERALHRRFRQHRIAGEWFSPAEDLMAFIANVALLAAAPTSLASDLEPFERSARLARRRRPAGVIEKKGRWYYRPTSNREREHRRAQGLPETIPLGAADSDQARTKWAELTSPESTGNLEPTDGELGNRTNVSR
jgi:hypothetical protein